MSKVIKLPFNDNQVVPVGWTGQNEYEEVTFDISAWLKRFPTGVVRVFYKLNTDGNLYPIADITSNTYIWKPQAADFPKPGRYSAQAIMESGTTIGKSDIFYFDIKKALDHLNQISDDPPPAYPPSYIQKIMQDMEAYAQRAESAAEHIPYYEDGKLYVWDEDTQQFVEFSLDIDSTVEEKVNEYFETHEVLTKDELDGAIDDALAKAKASGEFDGEDGAPGPQGPAGQDGQDGKDGKDGAQGPQGEPGKDGKDGQDGAQGPQGIPGQDGSNGADGYSPTVAIESISGGNRVTITDKNGPHSVDVMNGTDGQDGAPGPQGPAGKDADSFEIPITYDSEYGYETTVTKDDFLANKNNCVFVIGDIRFKPTEIYDHYAVARMVADRLNDGFIAVGTIKVSAVRSVLEVEVLENVYAQLPGTTSASEGDFLRLDAQKKAVWETIPSVMGASIPLGN